MSVWGNPWAGDNTIEELNNTASSGYFDVGDMRIQWGSSTSNTITFPQYFRNTSYRFVATINNSGWDTYSVTMRNKQTNRVDVRKMYITPTATGEVADYWVEWVAIGLKPL
jgi:hypothetical protein